MRFLMIGRPPLTAAVTEALVRHGHEVVTPDSVGLGGESTCEAMLRAAEKAQLEIITADQDLVEAPYAQDLWFGRSIVFLQLPGGDVEQDDAIDRLFARYPRLSAKRLYTVTGTRVKIRQLPGR